MFLDAFTSSGPCPACAIEIVGFDTLLRWSWGDEATVSQWLARRRGPLGTATD